MSLSANVGSVLTVDYIGILSTLSTLRTFVSTLRTLRTLVSTSRNYRAAV